MVTNSPAAVTVRYARLTISVFLVSVFSIVTAYYRSFTGQNLTFYDDEGMLMIVIKRFLEGHVLYDQVPTIYGPSYYFYEWCAHVLTSTPVSHDSVRFVSICFWVT